MPTCAKWRSALVVTERRSPDGQTLATPIAEHLGATAPANSPAIWWKPRPPCGAALAGPGPVCLLDMGDNVGGGSPGDGTILLQSLCEHGVAPGVCVPVSIRSRSSRPRQPESARRLYLELGGKTDPRTANRCAFRCVVRGLHDGALANRGPGTAAGCTTHGTDRDRRLEAGPTVMLTSRRVAPFSLEQLASCGIRTRRLSNDRRQGSARARRPVRVGVHRLVRVDTPGVTTADMTRLSIASTTAFVSV